MVIKIFEDFKEKECVNKVKEVWGVDPYEFYDMLLSELSGSVGLVFFSLFYPTPSEDCEILSCLKIENNKLSEFAYYNNIDAIVKTGKYSAYIEVYSYGEDDMIYKSLINKRLDMMDIPYVLEYNPERDGDSLYFQFLKIEESK